ncbi:MAG: tRNA (adenosine(37)-N6)-dimethylallyltransferase MiaA [Rhodospirillales bacterium]|nr:tRNA (adenosine(37)-N6)-dimethylallyltransferase MiaA [Rhodospirillales bacterium]
METDRPRVFVVAGPTASGKSTLAEALARRLRGQVVNADSVQLYGAFRILTARPSPAAEQRLPHRLYGILGPSDRCSAGRWRSLALDAVTGGHAARRPSVVVGGSGLYLEALLHGFAPIPCVPHSVRQAAARRLAAIGPAALHDELREVDPVLAARLEPGDRQRIVRGWEVWQATGRALSSWQESAPSPADLQVRRILLRPPRDAVRAAIEARVERMLAAGALDEVRAFQALDVPEDAPVRKAHGLRPLTRHLQGELSLDAAAVLTVNETRRYARRQDTWFRGRFTADHVLAHPPEVVTNEADALACATLDA